jgi:hypothetical protein
MTEAEVCGRGEAAPSPIWLFPCMLRHIREKERVSTFALKATTLALKILDLGIEGMLIKCSRKTEVVSNRP